MDRKRLLCLAAAAALAAGLAGCGSGGGENSSVDAASSATAQILPLAENVCVREGTEEDGTLLLDGSTIEGVMASDDYDTGSGNTYAYALVLTGEGRKQFRTATREIAKEQGQVTVWAGDEAICSPTVITMIDTKYVILNVASVTDDESYQAVLKALCGE